MAAKPKKKSKAKPAAAAPRAAPKAAPVDLAKAFSSSYVPPPPPVNVTVTLDPDVAPHFRDARSVNEALRALLRIVRQVKG
jgi:hypothetical protein